jgi:predicted ATPase with chaperone activity
MDNATQRRRIWPNVPETIEDLGIPPSMVVDLILRYLREHGTASLTGLKKALRLSFSIVEDIFQQFRQQQLLDVKGTVGNDYTFSLTTQGRLLATERSSVCRYAGPAPVPLAQYSPVVASQAARVHVSEDVLHEAFADLVLTDHMLDQLGPALVSQRSLFLYGPTGNGKTSIAERMLRVYSDAVLIPYAVEVDSQVILVFDPLVHRVVDAEPDATIDPRWVLCRRPCVVAGGELVASMLELRFDDSSGVYASPLQMKANNGMFVIDDFGRQAMAPRELLNRWIVPLDRRVDYLSLRYGVSFQLPFELMVVFATNLEPHDLADEAFLRRIHNKIYVEPVDPETFDTIFERVLSERQLPCDPGLPAQFRAICSAHAPGHLRACYPADMCNLLTWMAAYKGRPFDVNRESLARAADLYFTRMRKKSNL